jgi:YVTN family beta-propeller protein
MAGNRRFRFAGGSTMACVTTKTIVRPSVVSLLALLALLLLLWPALAQSPTPGDTGWSLPHPPPAGTRGPSALAFSPDGRILYAAEQDENQVDLLDPETGKALAHIPCGGAQPTGIALAPDGRTLAAANSFSGSLGILDTAARTLRGSVSLPGMPYEVVVAADGTAFVSVSQLDQVAVVDLAGQKVIGRIPVGRRPRAMAGTPDGCTVLCANMAGGTLSLIDVAARKEVARVPLPAINLRGAAVSPDGRLAFVTGQQAHNDLPTERPEAMWTNLLCVVRLAGAASRLERAIVLDQPERGAADPYGLAIAGAEGPIFVALSGTHELAVVDPRKSEVGSEKSEVGAPGQIVTRAPGTSAQRLPTGANPRAVVLRPGTDEVWVANHLGNSLTVLSPSSASGASPPTQRAIALEPPAKLDRRLKGRFLFTSAHLTRGMHFSCNSCHPDGNTEGLAWKFAHLHDGIERRNSRNLRGTLLLTSPYRWVPREQDFEEFVRDEIVGLLRGPRLAHADLHAFWDLVNELPMPPNPYRNSDGSFTAAAERGRALFSGVADCASCHGGTQFGGTGKSAWVGTTEKAIRIDIPHLVGVYDSAPYLHDARAATLEELFTRHNQGHQHGKAHLLTSEQMRDLIEFVREL